MKGMSEQGCCQGKLYVRDSPVKDLFQTGYEAHDCGGRWLLHSRETGLEFELCGFDIAYAELDGQLLVLSGVAGGKAVVDCRTGAARVMPESGRRLRALARWFEALAV